MSAIATSTINAPADMGLDDLRHLMRSVNETTEQLERTHAALQGQVVRLQGELAEANAQLHRSRELAALGEMAAGIAHEVRNPLASIGLYVQALAEDVADRPQAASLCEKVARAVGDLDAIVRDVLLFARQARLQRQPVEVQDLLRRTLDGCRPLLEQAGVEVRGARDDEQPFELSADRGLLVQALGNVVRNAVQVMAEAGTERPALDLSVARRRRRAPDGTSAEHVVVGVSDRGPGLKPQIVKRMFNPFFTTRKTGTGLGLAIVNRIVEAHGGHVSVGNRPGGGATVELCLPSQPPESQEHRESPEARNGRPDGAPP